MRAGKLDRTITLQRSVESVAPSGAVSSAWVDLATVRAELLRATSSEDVTAYGEAETASRTFRIRWLSNAEITTADRVVYRGKAFQIRELDEIGRRKIINIICNIIEM